MTISNELASAVLALLKPKHPGGRPKGVKNKGPDKLDKAIVALNIRRSRMTPEQVQASERRVQRFMTKKFSGKDLALMGLPAKENAVWQSWRLRKALVKLGIPKAELDVVVRYKRSEERPGMSDDLHRAKGIKRPSGPVVGYKMEQEEIVEKSLTERDTPATLLLWGNDVTSIISRDHDEEIGWEPAPRRQTGPGRRKLARVELLQEFTVHHVNTEGRVKEIKWVGAGSGKNGFVLPTFENGRLSYAAEPTIGECRENLLRNGSGEPVTPAEQAEAKERAKNRSELYRQLDWVRKAPPLRPIRRFDSFSLDRSPMHKVKVEFLPRSEGEQVQPIDPTGWPEVQESLALHRWRKRGCPLPVIQPVVDGFLPRRLDVALSMEEAKPTSVVWSDDGEPLRGTDEYWRRRFRLKECWPMVKERVKVPDRTTGWHVLPILDPPCGFVKLF